MPVSPSASTSSLTSVAAPCAQGSGGETPLLSDHLQAVDNTVRSSACSASPAKIPDISPSPDSQPGFRSILLEHVKSLVPEAMQHPQQMEDSALVETVELLIPAHGALLAAVLPQQNIDEFAKAAVSKIADENMKAEAIKHFSKLMRYLSDETCAQLLHAAVNITNTKLKKELLEHFSISIEDIRPGQRTEFVKAVAALPGNLNTPLYNLLPQISVLNQQDRSRLLQTAMRIANEPERAMMLTRVNLEDLEADERTQIVEAALAIKNEEEQADVLKTLFSQLSHLLAEYKNAVIEAVTRIKPELRAQVFTGLQIKQNDLSPQNYNKLLDAALEITGEAARTRALACLVVQMENLPAALRQETITLALTIDDEKERAQTIIELAKRMKPSNSAELGSALFDKVHELKEEYNLLWVLGSLANKLIYFNNDQLRSLMGLRNNIQAELSRNSVLEFWISNIDQVRLDEMLLRELIKEAFSITNEPSKACAMLALSLNLKDVPQDLRQEVINATLGLSKMDYRVRALKGLANSADCLNEEEGQLFLQAVTAIPGKKRQAWLFDHALAAIDRANIRIASSL